MRHSDKHILCPGARASSASMHLLGARNLKAHLEHATKAHTPERHGACTKVRAPFRRAHPMSMSMRASSASVHHRGASNPEAYLSAHNQRAHNRGAHTEKRAPQNATCIDQIGPTVHTPREGAARALNAKHVPQWSTRSRGLCARSPPGRFVCAHSALRTPECVSCSFFVYGIGYNNLSDCSHV